MGDTTIKALLDDQLNKGLAHGALTHESLDSLGVKYATIKPGYAVTTA